MDLAVILIGQVQNLLSVVLLGLLSTALAGHLGKCEGLHGLQTIAIYLSESWTLGSPGRRSCCNQYLVRLSSWSIDSLSFWGLHGVERTCAPALSLPGSNT